MNTNIEKFGQYIGMLRSRKGISQEALGKLAGLSKVGISNIENGKNKEIVVSTLIGLSSALNIPIPKLILAYEGKDPEKWAEDNGEVYKQAVRAFVKTIPKEEILSLIETPEEKQKLLDQADPEIIRQAKKKRGLK